MMIISKLWTTLESENSRCRLASVRRDSESSGGKRTGGQGKR